MKHFKLSFFLDIITTNILLFLICFVWLNFIFHSTLFSLIFDIIILIIFNILYFYLKNKRNKKFEITKNLNFDISNYFLTLLSNSYSSNLSFFCDIFSNNKLKAKIENNYILINKNLTKEIIKKNNIKIIKTNINKISNIKKLTQDISLKNNSNNQKYIIFPLFTLETLTFEYTLQQISPYINKYKKIIILCNEINIKDKQKLENFNNITIKIMNKNEVFKNIFQKYNVYPKIIFTYKKNKKFDYKTFFLLSLNRQNAKRYFFSGLFVFLFSFFVRLNLYYVIFSSLMFLLCLISLKNKEITS